MNNNKNLHQSGNEFSLFVGDLPHDCSDETLQRLFQSKFKSVRSVQIIKHEDGSSRGFGFIRFEDQTDFQAALSQEMKIGNTTLRLDTAHRYSKSTRGRYNSFNSTVSNNSNHHNHHHFANSNSNLRHHHHHHNQPHHHPHHHSQHRHQHGSHQNQAGGGSGNNKSLLSEHTPTNQHQGPNHQVGGRHNSNNNTNKTNNGSNYSNPPHANVVNSGQQQSSQQQLQQNSQQGHNLFNSNQKSSHQSSPDSKSGSKHTSLSLSGDDSVKTPNQSQSNTTQSTPNQQSPLVSSQTSSQTLSQQSQHAIAHIAKNPVGSQAPAVNLTSPTATTTAPTLPITSVNQSVAAAAAVSPVAIHNSQQNLNPTHQQPLGHDLRSYVHHPQMLDSHLMVSAEQPSVVPPTSVYGHMYPYGPPHPFGYIPPPHQPNPVMPISAVPPAPPNSVPTTGGVGQQQSLSAAAVSGNRFNSAQQHHHSQPHHHTHHHQPQQQASIPQGMDASGLGGMPGGVQAPHQGPFYYYYPPLYFDQTGSATGAPQNHLYHHQTFHPQFFAVPGPTYLPSAPHTFNQHQPQPPTASQSDALLNQQQQAPPQPPQTHQTPQQPPTKDR